MVDLTRDADGQVRARLLDLVLGRSGPAYARWLHARQPEFRAQITSAALDPFRGYANALRCPTRSRCWTPSTSSSSAPRSSTKSAAASSTSNSGGAATRTTRSTRSAACSRHGLEHLSEAAQPAAGRLLVGDPHCEVELAWSCYRQLRAIYAGTASPHQRRTLAELVIASFPTCPIPEVARLGRTLRAWRSQVLAYFDTDGLSNGGTEAINMLIEKARRLAHGYRNFDNYRLRMLLVASGTRTRRVRSERP